ncbi:MAG: GFA family protein [Alphaproteobacteria bacterium]|nr:GFA family protein [Alphaproteobacteria bacterium]
MDENSGPATGGCHCGAVRYEATGAPLYVPYCHCGTCRGTTGAPVVLFVMYRQEQVRFTRGERKVYRSSPEVQRTFCAECGTPLSYEGDWGGNAIIEFYVGTLDDPETFTPDRHTFYGERLGWFDVADGLPRYNGSSAGSRPDSHGPAIESEPPSNR